MMRTTEMKWIEEIYTQYHDKLLRFCLCHLHDMPSMQADAEDIVQETILSAASHFDELRNHENIGGWLMKTCYYRLGNAKKRARVRQKHVEIYLDQPDAKDVMEKRSQLEDWLNRCESDELLDELYRLLTQTEKEMFHDYFIDDKKIREISDDKHVSIYAVKNALHRIRKKVKEIRQKKFMVFFLMCVSFWIARNCIE